MSWRSTPSSKCHIDQYTPNDKSNDVSCLSVLPTNAQRITWVCVVSGSLSCVRDMEWKRRTMSQRQRGWECERGCVCLPSGQLFMPSRCVCVYGGNSVDSGLRGGALREKNPPLRPLCGTRLSSQLMPLGLLCGLARGRRVLFSAASAVSLWQCVCVFRMVFVWIHVPSVCVHLMSPDGGCVVLMNERFHGFH